MLNYIIDHQLKLMDSNWRLSAKPEAHILATSCLNFLGPQTITPTSLPSHSNRISAKLTNWTHHCPIDIKYSKRLVSAFACGG
jgi:hypothetical protein